MEESSSSVTVCFEVLAGRTATRSISMQIRTLDGEAKGTITCMYFIAI